MINSLYAVVRGEEEETNDFPPKKYPRRTDDLVMNCTTLILDTVEIAFWTVIRKSKHWTTQH